MLHDGLGSIPQWRDVPGRVAAQTGMTVMAYERAGHGDSLPVPSGPWPADWLHREAEVLADVLARVGAVRPWIIGHSDGASTALLHAIQPDADVRAVLSLAAHSWVEQICSDAIVDMRANPERIVDGLARSHAHPAEIFEAWSGVWVSDDFRPWDIRPVLSAITVPVVVAQGAKDTYAGDAHAHLTAQAIGPNATSRIVPDVGHIMHHDDETVVVDLIVEFVAAT